MRAAVAVFGLILCSTALAKDPQAVPIGKGIYMMTDRNFTIFGSSDGIVAKLMTKANVFCQKNTGKEAELVDSDGSEAVPGTINNSGTLRRAAQGATGTIYFRCGAATPTESVASDAALPDSYYERVEGLRTKVMSGDIPVAKGIVSSQASSAFAPLATSDAEMLEGRSTWWVDDNGTWFMHLQNVTESGLEAIEFSVNFGSCSAPTSPVQKAVIQLQRPIRPGDQAVINFSRPISTDKVEATMCGVVTAAWGTRGGA
jgi:hypothetical protein